MFTKSFQGNLRFLSFLKRPASIAVLLFFFVGIADGAMLPFFALWAQHDAGIPVGWIGVLFGCYAGGEILATPFIGGIADRKGRRPVLLCSTLGVGLGFLLLYFAHGVWQAACVLLLIGISESVLHPTIMTVIADSVPHERIRSQAALARTLSSLGRAAGPALGAILVLHSLGSVFVASSAAILVCTAIVACCLPETMTGAGEEDDDEEGLSSLLPALRDGRLARLLLWVILLEMCGSWIEAALPLYAHTMGTLSASGVGALFSYGALLVAVLQFPLTHLTRRVSEAKLVLASGAVLVASFAALLVSPGVPSLVVAMSGFALADMLFGPLIPAAVNALASSSKRATYMAAVSVTNDIKDTLGPATGTALFASSLQLPWVAGIGLAAGAAVGLAAAIARAPRQRTAADQGAA